MEYLPGKDAENGVSYTVRDFVEAAQGLLQLEVVVGGKALEHKVEEPIINRPGLALTGFFADFAWKRLQVIGNAEAAYLRSMEAAMRLQRLREIAAHKAYVVVYTNGRRPGADVMRLARRLDVAMLSTPLDTLEFARHATHVLERLGAPRTSIYGTMVEVYGLGVLFEGDPGLGKSETALGLIKRGAALIADDLTCIRKDTATNLLFGSASEATAGFMELRGIGIMHVPSIFGVNALRSEKRLQLVITFKKLKDIVGEVDRIGQTRKMRTILGVEVPNIIIPVSEGRDLVNLVETAAQQQKLILSGQDPVTELSERLHRRSTPSRIDKRRVNKNG